MRRGTFYVIILILASRMVWATCPPDIPSLPTLNVPVPAPPASCTAPPPSVIQLDDYIPFTFVNNSNVSADEIYVVILVNSSTQFLSFSDSGGHKVASLTAFTPSTYLSSPFYPPNSSTKYTYKLSEFELIDTNTYTFYIPNTGNTGVANSNVMASSRILLSLKNPLTYFIDASRLVQLPPEFDQTNDNYFTLNDKIEFDLGSNAHNRLNLNLTGVDFFGLPLLVQANYNYLDGATYRAACVVTGMPAGVTLNDVFSQYDTALSSLSSPFDTSWGGLVAKYTNPASAGGGECVLRIYAPATAMGSSQTQTNPTPISFPADYFLSSASSPDTCTWFNAVWSGTTLSGGQAFYQNKKSPPYLVLDATTKHGAATAKGYEVQGENGQYNFLFEIQGGPDKNLTVTFPQPRSSKAFFTGAVSDYAPAISGGASSDTKSQVLKVFATCIISGLFPINCLHPDPITITSSYVQSQSANYYKNNAILSSSLTGCNCVPNVPWFDFYSRTLLTIGTPNLFYTSAYSDFLGTDGTIVITSLNDHNADATITVSLDDCFTSIHFTDPYNDTTNYSLTVGIPSDATVEYSSTIDGAYSSTIPSTVDGDKLCLKVTYNTGLYAGQSYVTQIAPAARIFHPVLPGSGTITTTGSSTSISIGASPTSD